MAAPEGLDDLTTPPATPAESVPPAGPRRSLVALVAVVAVLAVVASAAFLLLRAPGEPPFAHAPLTLGERTPGYIVSRDELRRRAALAADGVEPYATAVEDLLADAEAALAEPPRPQEPLEITGTEGPFVDDSARAYGLALAYAVTGDRRYAEAAAAIITAWVATTRTTVGTCPDSGACQTSLIISRTAPGFVFAADLIADAGVLDTTEETAFRDWLRTVILPTASELDNNWGDAGTFTRVVLTDYLGDGEGLLHALDRWLTQQDLVAADGHIPEETRRGDAGMSYTQEALQYRVAVAAIAERYGLDLWSYVGAGGATVRDAIDYLAGYWSRAGDWPWDPNVEAPSTGPFWEIAYARFLDPAYVPIIEERRPYGDRGHSALRWTTLTSGVPFELAAPS